MGEIPEFCSILFFGNRACYPNKNNGLEGVELWI